MTTNVASQPTGLTSIVSGSADVAGVVTAMTDGERPYLAQALRSVIENEGIGQVVLCVREDNTWLELELGDLVHHPLLEIYRLPQMPVGATRNFGVGRVRLPWMALCDGDDVWRPGKIRRQREFADLHQVDIIGADQYLTDPEGRIRACGFGLVMPMPSSWLLKTDILRRHPFDGNNLVGTEDSEWWFALDPSYKKARLAELLLNYRVRPASLSDWDGNKRRKARAVAMGSVPVFGRLVFVATWLFRWWRRKQTYPALPPHAARASSVAKAAIATGPVPR